MGRRGWINLGLLLVVTLLGLAILFSPAQQEEETLVPLTPLQPQQVNSIGIRNPNGPAFTLGGGAFLQGEGEVAGLCPGPGIFSVKALGVDLNELLPSHLQDEGEVLATGLAGALALDGVG